jgi:uncharacterized protein with FMN-binding domain
VLAATGAGLGLLLSYHTKPISSGLKVSATLPPTPPDSSASTTTPTTAPTTSATTTPGSGASTPTTVPSTTTTSPPSTRSGTGQDIPYQYGDLQLKVVEKGSKITEIDIVSDNATDPRSAQINAQAIPMLEQQAFSVQSANIDGVSGATFTSAAFAQALQSALDQAGS